MKNLRMFESLFKLGTLELTILRDLILLLGILSFLYFYRVRGREQDTNLEKLNTELIQRDKTIRDQTAQITEKDNSLNLLKVEVSDLDKHNQDSLTRARNAEARVEDLRKRLKDMETEAEGLGDELVRRDEAIRDQAAQIEEKDADINRLKSEVADLEKQNQDSVARAEDAEARAGELENSVGEKEREIAALRARTRAMQDDFTIIAGIGPRVSAILRAARINTFAKLADTDEGRIRDILEAENPSLLRLTDPSTWSEQARLAAEEDWEALSALQESLKEG